MKAPGHGCGAMSSSFRRTLLMSCVVPAIVFAAPAALTAGAATEERMIVPGETGSRGGRLVLSLRSEPKTLNPVTSLDTASRDLLRCLNADLIHINRETQLTEPALAKTWKASGDGKSYTLHLRRGVRFSDGQPLTVDDVLFTFQVYLDEKINSPQRDLLVVGGKPLHVIRVDDDVVRFDLAQPYAAAERLFDSVAILPKHLLESAYKEGKLAQAWGATTPSNLIAGLGPYRLKEYVPGQRIVFERNPYYWKEDAKGTRLPYLDEISFRIVASEDAQVIRFQAAEADLVNRISADDYLTLEKDQQSRGYRLYDLGPSLDYNFLLFNLNDLPPEQFSEIAWKQAWFGDVRFRQAVSSAIDRDGIVRLVYHGRAQALWGHVSPGNRRWIDRELLRPARSVEHGKQLLREAGFSWRDDGALLDSQGRPVEFTLLTSASNPDRQKIATLLQDDLKQIGMDVHVVPLEFRALLDRVFNTKKYEACILRLSIGDADPNPEMNVWLSNGSTHLWHLGEEKPATPWEAEIDRLMQEQLTTLDYRARKKLYDRMQQIEAENLPLIPLASPNILVGARNRIGNFHPAVLDPYTIWNIEQLFIRPEGARASR